jgi:hypothetical protein
MDNALWLSLKATARQREELLLYYNHGRAIRLRSRNEMSAGKLTDLRHLSG